MFGGQGVKEYYGSGSGSGPVFTPGWGWIYYSLSDEDPLADSLPNGTYRFSSNSGTTQKYTVHIHETTCPDSMGKSDIKDHTAPAILSYQVNGGFFYEPFAGLGVAGFFTANSVLACINSSAQGQVPRAWDTQLRYLSDGMMTGSFSTGWVGAVQNSARWNIEKVMDIHPEIEKPDEYYRPKGDWEKNTIKINASIKDYPELEGKWRFTLFETSKETGYCMNAGDQEGFDFEFKKGQSGFSSPEETADGWKIETDHTANEVTVAVQALDYGAWSKIKVEVNVDGHWYTAKAYNGKDFVTVPLDEDENHIADWWQKEHKIDGEAATDDNDSEPEVAGENREPGDGFRIMKNTEVLELAASGKKRFPHGKTYLFMTKSVTGPVILQQRSL